MLLSRVSTLFLCLAICNLMSSSLGLFSLRLIFWTRTKSALGPPKCPATDHRQRQLETMCNVRPSVRQLNWATAGQVITQRRQQRCKLELNYSISWIRRWIPHSASLALELRLRLRLQLPTKMEPRQAARQAGRQFQLQLLCVDYRGNNIQYNVGLLTYT